MHRRNCAVKTFVETKRKKIKAGSEYLYYIPREVTLSLYDCEPLQMNPQRGYKVYLDSNQMYMYRPTLYMTR